MIQHELVQGSPEWLAYRRDHDNASDAPAMMGCSPYRTRSDLLHERHTGLTAEVDPATQRRFDDGHRFEALARPLGAKLIGEDLYPVVGSEGSLSASFDGLTMLEDTAFEHKSLNDELRTIMVHGCTGDALPLHYQIQMEQQCMVAGCGRVLFMASKWDGETLVEELHCWYMTNHALADKIRAGWAQFAADVAAYVAPEVAPIVTGKPPESLPALRIEVSGAVTASNLAEFKSTALAAIRSVNRELSTDQHFADAEKAVKWCGDVEDRLASAKQHALSQTASIDELFRTMDDISAEARRVRLDLEKLVKARKESIRGEIVSDGVKYLREHIDNLNARIGKAYMPTVAADFGGVIKGKRTIESLRGAVADELARTKIEANAIADRIQINLNTLREQAANHAFLFSDAAALVLKDAEHVTVLVKQRIAEHQQAEAARLEAERERIRKEEADRAERDLARRRAAVAAIRFPDPEPVASVTPVIVTPAEELAAAQASPEGAELSPAAQALNEEQGAQRFARAHPVVARSFSETKPAAEVVWINTKQLSERIGVAMNAELADELGFPGIRRGGPGLWWDAARVIAIGEALIDRILNHIDQVAEVAGA